MNILIVDDETPAREELLWLLEQCGPDLRVVAQAADARAARELLQHPRDGEAPIDLVFLDVDMPGIGGMRLAELLQQADVAKRPMIIFATAYQEYALDAFSVDAVDYLLKPVRLGRLKQAVDKARARHASASAPGGLMETSSSHGLAAQAGAPSAPGSSSAPRYLERISVEERGVYQVIPIDDILFFESEDGIVVVQTRQSRHITDFSLKFLEQSLDPKTFFRSHRSTIVNIDAIASIAPWGAGTYRLILDRERDIGVPLARSRASELKAIIPWSATALED